MLREHHDRIARLHAAKPKRVDGRDGVLVALDVAEEDARSPLEQQRVEPARFVPRDEDDDWEHARQEVTASVGRQRSAEGELIVRRAARAGCALTPGGVISDEDRTRLEALARARPHVVTAEATGLGARAAAAHLALQLLPEGVQRGGLVVVRGGSADGRGAAA